MPLYLVHATDNAGAAEIRAGALDEHIAYLQSRSEIVPDRASAQEFSNGDPFTRDGVFSSINITRVRKGIWQPDAAEGA